MTPRKQQIADAIDVKAGKMSDVSDKLWDVPEIRFTLKESADLLCAELEKEGFSVQRGVSGMDDAFVAVFGDSGPVLGFLGEYDALPTLSQTAGSMKKEPLSEGAHGHGCGHQALGAGALAAAIGLKDYLVKSGEKAVVKYFGCPGEESGSGKAYMARDDAFDGVDAFLTWHPMADTQPWTFSTLANYQVYFHFKGRSSHAAAAPHMGRSALDACELMNVGVNYLREHIIPEARVHYAYTDVGGKAPNVVQATASQLYFIRAPKSSQVREIFERVVDIAKGAALMTGTSMEFEFDSACAEYIVNKTLTEAAYNNMLELGSMPFTGEEFSEAQKYVDQFDEAAQNALRAKIKKMYEGESVEFLEKVVSKSLLNDVCPLKFADAVLPGSTDVGDASWQAPTAQFTLGVYPAGTVPHSWQWVAFGKSSAVHKGLIYAGKVMAMTALDIIEKPELLQRAKTEWKESLGGEVYRSAIPADIMPK